MLSGIVTALLIVVFIGICVWAYSGKRKKDFEEAARLPLDENEGMRTRDENEENGHE